MALDSQNHNRDGLSEPNSILVVYMDPVGYTVIRYKLYNLPTPRNPRLHPKATHEFSRVISVAAVALLIRTNFWIYRTISTIGNPRNSISIDFGL